MKIGIVGLGSIGSRHAANLEALGHQVVGYDPQVRCDVGFERDIYEQCDAVVVATPSPYHEAGIRAAVERGKHVLVEKPISVAVGGLPAILESAASKNLCTMTGTNLRFHPGVQWAREQIADGYVGTPLWASFTCASLSAKHPYLSDGVILNTGAHEVDLALHLLGPAKVISATARCGDYGDDIADFVLEHESGVRSSFHLDFITPNEFREFRIFGTENNISVDLPSRITNTDNRFQCLSGSYDEDYRTEMSAFIGRIEGNDVPGATGEEGLATLRVLLNVRKMAGLTP